MTSNKKNNLIKKLLQHVACYCTKLTRQNLISVDLDILIIVDTWSLVIILQSSNIKSEMIQYYEDILLKLFCDFVSVGNCSTQVYNKIELIKV